MIGIKRSIIMAVTGAALVVSGSQGAIGAPAVSSVTSVAPADTNVLQVKKYHHHGGGRHHGRSSIWWGAPLLAAPFLYNGYDDWGDYNYSGYGYRYGGGNSCYRACRYEHGPRYCRYNWEDYC